MAYKLIETALAQADLDAILSYLALSLENPTAATAFANEVEKCYTVWMKHKRLFTCFDSSMAVKITKHCYNTKTSHSNEREVLLRTVIFTRTNTVS